MKHEWRRAEKSLYLPSTQASLLTIPAFQFLMLQGKGNPNSPAFAERVEALYSLSYGIKMCPKKGIQPIGYYDYTVYPLEGIWDISDKGKDAWNGVLNKDELIYTLMIRQPSFVTPMLVNTIQELLSKKNPNSLLSSITFKEMTDSDCVQIMHIGSYDSESASFEKISIFLNNQGLSRLNHIHREIYLSDVRKVPTDKLQTVLRVQVQRHI